MTGGATAREPRRRITREHELSMGTLPAMSPDLMSLQARAHGVAEAVTAHNRHTCPICQANDALSNSGMAQGASDSADGNYNSIPTPLEGATQNNTSVTGASANSTTSVEELLSSKSIRGKLIIDL